MEDIKDRLITVIVDYKNSDSAGDIDAEDMADYLIKTIDELHIKPMGVIMDTYNNLVICPHCHEIIGTVSDWTPKFCKECGKPLTGGSWTYRITILDIECWQGQILYI